MDTPRLINDMYKAECDNIIAKINNDKEGRDKTIEKINFVGKYLTRYEEYEHGHSDYFDFVYSNLSLGYYASILIAAINNNPIIAQNIRHFILSKHEFTGDVDFSLFLNLEYLDLRANKLECRLNLSSCHKLHTLLISDNKFEEMPIVANSLELKILHLGINKISLRPADLRGYLNLRSLDLSALNLKSIPDLSDCVLLEELYLMSNNLKQTPYLPECRNLKKLGLFHNDITIPPDILIHPELVLLDLEESPLTMAGKVAANALMMIKPNLRIKYDKKIRVSVQITKQMLFEHFPETLRFKEILDNVEDSEITAFLRNFSLPKSWLSPYLLAYPPHPRFMYYRSIIIPSLLGLPCHIAKNISEYLLPNSKFNFDKEKHLTIFRNIFGQLPERQNYNPLKLIDEYEEEVQQFHKAKPLLFKMANSSKAKVNLSALNSFIKDNGFNPHNLSQPNSNGDTPLSLATKHENQLVKDRLLKMRINDA